MEGTEHIIISLQKEYDTWLDAKDEFFDDDFSECDEWVDDDYKSDASSCTIDDPEDQHLPALNQHQQAVLARCFTLHINLGLISSFACILKNMLNMTMLQILQNNNLSNNA